MHRAWLGCGAIGPDDAGEQLGRLVVVEHIKIDQPAAGQGGEPVPGGHDDGARARARQQRPDLRRVPRIVERDQDLPLGQAGAVHGSALLGVHRYPGSVHPEIPEEPGQHLVRRNRLLAHPEQADIQLPVRKIWPKRVGRMDRERGLAQAGGAGHHGDGHRRVVSPPGLSDQAAQPLQRHGPAGEVADVGGQLGRHAPRR